MAYGMIIVQIPKSVSIAEVCRKALDVQQKEQLLTKYQARKF